MAGERILIVDDNKFNVRLAEHVLRTEGFEVRSVEDGDTMLAMLASWTPRLILMDLGLPGADGLSLAADLRRDPAHDAVTIVAFSAEPGVEEIRRAREAGCDGYIAKPIDVSTFGADVRRHLDARRS